MKNTYGYKPLSYELIELFQTGAPDFNAAEELIRRGADVNDQGDDKAENVLSTILIRDITFGHHSISKGTTDYGQPITTLHMDNGAELTFRTNFGEVEDLESCAYYYFESK